MHNSTEDIMHDLYELEPSLRERDEEVRALVVALLKAKPDVVIEESFVNHLRQKLLHAQVVQTTTPHHSPYWWILHLAPVGAIALLALTLMPSYMKPLSEVPKVNSIEEMSPVTFDAPSAKRAGIASEEVPSLMQVTNDALPQNSFTVPTQTPGNQVRVDSISLAVPGFLVIQEVKNGEPGIVLGTSTLLSVGLTEHIEIPLATSMRSDETFFATLYTDQGDGIFTKEDSPMLDASGISSSPVLFSTTSETPVDSENP